MSLNDVYKKKYVPTPKSEALEYIDSVLHEAEEDIRSELTRTGHRNGNDHPNLQVWKTTLARVDSGVYNDDQANEILSRKRLPLLEDDYEPSLDNLVQWRVQHVPLKMDYNLLSAIRDACCK